jgi:cytosine/adenosine deaminase-related metal-dependent hydrolase
MDRNCPDDYCESSPSQSVADTCSLIEYLAALPPDSHFPNDPLVKPVVTPRFAISCSDALLTQLGELVATDPTMAIQTHMSENTAEVEQTLQLFPGCETYTEVYKKFGLLRRGTILAHCVWLSEKEIKMISECEAGISHCPTSNLNLMSGGARVGAMLDAGIHVNAVLISVNLQPADSRTSWAPVYRSVSAAIAPVALPSACSAKSATHPCYPSSWLFKPLPPRKDRPSSPTNR